MTDIVILHKAPDGSARIEQWLRNKDTVLNGTYLYAFAREYGAWAMIMRNT